MSVTQTLKTQTPDSSPTRVLPAGFQSRRGLVCRVRRCGHSCGRSCRRSSGRSCGGRGGGCSGGCSGGHSCGNSSGHGDWRRGRRYTERRRRRADAWGWRSAHGVVWQNVERWRRRSCRTWYKRGGRDGCQVRGRAGVDAYVELLRRRRRNKLAGASKAVTCVKYRLW